MTRSPRRILVVDDEKMIRHVMSRTLIREGYDVILASGPSEGLAILARGPVDLVISDLLMPEMTGLEFLKLVRSSHPGCIRVLITGHSDVGPATEAVDEGEIDHLLTKPWDGGELNTMLNLAFERSPRA